MEGGPTDDRRSIPPISGWPWCVCTGSPRARVTTWCMKVAPLWRSYIRFLQISVVQYTPTILNATLSAPMPANKEKRAAVSSQSGHKNNQINRTTTTGQPASQPTNPQPASLSSRLALRWSILNERAESEALPSGPVKGAGDGKKYARGRAPSPSLTRSSSPNDADGLNPGGRMLNPDLYQGSSTRREAGRRRRRRRPPRRRRGGGGWLLRALA